MLFPSNTSTNTDLFDPRQANAVSQLEQLRNLGVPDDTLNALANASTTGGGNVPELISSFDQLGGGGNTPGAPGQATGLFSRLGGALGELDGNQLINAGLGTARALTQGYLGFQQLGLAKDQFRHQRQTANRNFEVQRSEYNRRLLERQQARSGAAPTQHQAPQQYLNQFGIRG